MNRADYEWSRACVAEHQLDKVVSTVWFSPMFNVDTAQVVDGYSPAVPTLARDLAD